MHFLSGFQVLNVSITEGSSQTEHSIRSIQGCGEVVRRGLVLRVSLFFLMSRMQLRQKMEATSVMERRILKQLEALCHDAQMKAVASHQHYSAMDHHVAYGKCTHREKDY